MANKQNQGAGRLSNTNTGSQGSTVSKVDLDHMTFGIELEFVVICPAECFSRLCLEGMSNAVKALAHLMNRKGIPTESLYSPMYGAPRFSRWNISKDCHSLTDAEYKRLPPGYTEEPVEISSRKLSFADKNWQREVASVLEAVNQLRDFGCLVVTNQTCGFHVHIGFGDEFVPLKACKNVFQVATALERCFDQLQTTSRILPGDGASYDKPKHFNAPLSWFHTHAASEVDNEGDPNVFHWLQNIELCDSYDEISGMFQVEIPSIMGPRYVDAHNSVLNFDNCVSSHFSNPAMATGTVEWRQHESTLDFSEIKAWVIFVANVVQFCNTASAKEVFALCANAWNHEFSIFNLMEAIGCTPDHIAYYRTCRSVARYDGCAEAAVRTRISLEAGDYTGLEALRIQNVVDDFQRNSPFGVNIVSSQKLYSGAQGRRMGFDTFTVSSADALFDRVVREAVPGRETMSVAKRLAFCWMSHS